MLNRHIYIYISEEIRETVKTRGGGLYCGRYDPGFSSAGLERNELRTWEKDFFFLPFSFILSLSLSLSLLFVPPHFPLDIPKLGRKQLLIAVAEAKKKEKGKGKKRSGTTGSHCLFDFWQSWVFNSCFTGSDLFTGLPSADKTIERKDTEVERDSDL